jgi:hypothetical protein
MDNDLWFSFSYTKSIPKNISFLPELIYGDDLEMVRRDIEVPEEETLCCSIAMDHHKRWRFL